jgi:DNA-binding IclR family transcriptional regulator
MSIIRSIQILQTLHHYISRKATGSREQFAQKLNMSLSTLEKYLREMKMLHFPIAFDKINNTYYYTEENDEVAALLLNLNPSNVLNRQQLKDCACAPARKETSASLYYFCIDPETGKKTKSIEPC